MCKSRAVYIRLGLFFRNTKISCHLSHLWYWSAHDEMIGSRIFSLQSVEGESCVELTGLCHVATWFPHGSQRPLMLTFLYQWWWWTSKNTFFMSMIMIGRLLWLNSKQYAVVANKDFERKKIKVMQDEITTEPIPFSFLNLNFFNVLRTFYWFKSTIKRKKEM